MSEFTLPVPPNTPVLCHQRGQGYTLTGITGAEEKTSVVFSGTRYTLEAIEVLSTLIPAAAKAGQNESK